MPDTKKPPRVKQWRYPPVVFRPLNPAAYLRQQVNFSPGEGGCQWFCEDLFNPRPANDMERIGTHWSFLYPVRYIK